MLAASPLRMAKDIRQQLQDKGKEIQERLAEAVETMKRNVRDGVQSAVSDNNQRFGRPPSVVRRLRPRTSRPTRRR